MGALSSVGSVWLLAKLFCMDNAILASLLPKSVTTAIALPLSEQNGGIPQITMVAVVIAGTMGAVLGPTLAKLFRLADNKVATGLAIGCSSHAAGTSTAVQMGEAEGAMSGLAIGICGVFTVLLSLCFKYLL